MIIFITQLPQRKLYNCASVVGHQIIAIYNAVISWKQIGVVCNTLLAQLLFVNIFFASFYVGVYFEVVESVNYIARRIIYFTNQGLEAKVSSNIQNV